MTSYTSSLHPVCLLSRSDSPTSSLYHSFFLVNIIKKELVNEGDIDKDVMTVWRVPENAPLIDDIEAGVKFFVACIPDADSNDVFGSFVITTSNGSRFFAAWRGSNDQLFISISKFPLLSFSRTVFSFLAKEKFGEIFHVLLSLSELPIIQLPFMRYNINFACGNATLNFSSCGQVEDDDMTLIAIRLMDPNMLVSAWEALILERKVLVISSVHSVVRYCCEFLRRLVQPLVVINTYIPFLPDILLNAIEAPFPYLVGAESKTIFDSDVDLSDTVVVDLDRKTVKTPTVGHFKTSAPESLKKSLAIEIANILVRPLSQWVSRSSDDLQLPTQVQYANMRAVEDTITIHPHTLVAQSDCTASIIDCFIRANLSIMCSRACDVRAFFRFPDNPLIANRYRFTKEKSRRSVNSMGSMGFVQKRGVYCGCIQLIIQNTELDSQQFIPCWMEIDTIRISLYEHADELALLNVLSKNIESISPSPAEPEGHVFEVQVRGTSAAYRFASTDPESRREWINAIENFIDRGNSSTRPANLEKSNLEKVAISALNTPQEKVKSMSRSNSECGDETTSDDNAIDLSTSRGVSFRSMQYNTSSKSVFDNEQCPPEDFKEMNDFRFNVLESQMFSYFSAKSEFEEYETILRSLGVTVKSLTESDSDITSGVVRLSLSGRDDAVDEHHDMLKHISSSDQSFIADIERLWGIYVSKDILLSVTDDEYLFSAGESPSKTDSDRKTANYLRQRPDKEKLAVAYLIPGADASTNRHGKRFSVSSIDSRASIANQTETTTKQAKSNRSLFSAVMNFARPSLKESLSENLSEVNVSMMSPDKSLRACAEELLQGVAIAHRKCESELKDLLIQNKMSQIASIISENTTNVASSKTYATEVKYSLPSIIQGLAAEEVVGAEVTVTPPSSWTSTLKKWSELKIGDNSSNKESIRASVSEVPRPNMTRISVTGADFAVFGNSEVETDGYDSIFGNDIRTTTTDDPIISSAIRRTSISQKNIAIKTKLSRNQFEELIKANIKDCLMSQYSKVHNDDSAESLGNTESSMVPVLQTLIFFVLMRTQSSASSSKALALISDSALVEQALLMECLIKCYPEFVKSRTDLKSKDVSDTLFESQFGLVSSSRMKDFLVMACSRGRLVGLQAFRLATELIHRHLSRLLGEKILEESNFDSYSSKSVTAPSDDSSEKALEEFRHELSHGIFSRRRSLVSYSRTKFQFVDSTPSPAAAKSDVLNEVVLCTSSSVKACELSTQLLTNIREILKSAYDNGEYESKGLQSNDLNSRSTNAGVMKLKLTPLQRESILSSSAFRSFELQSCQLQRLEISNLDDDSKIIFFSNIFNVLYVHGVLRRNFAGATFLEKFSFISVVKYNISGQIWSLCEIEHRILRAQSATPDSIFGPVLTLLAMHEKSKPHPKYLISKPVPLISFTLFSASISSPQLTILWDKQNLNIELQRAASAYLNHNVKVDMATKTIAVPELLKFYWADFGGTRRKVVSFIITLVDEGLAKQLELILADQIKPKVVFIQFDWNFSILL